MRYLEYVYLILALGMAAALSVHFGQLPKLVLAIMVGMIAIFAFLFAFRRQQRQFAARQHPPENPPTPES